MVFFLFPTAAVNKVLLLVISLNGLEKKLGKK